MRILIPTSAIMTIAMVATIVAAQGQADPGNLPTPMEKVMPAMPATQVAPNPPAAAAGSPMGAMDENVKKMQRQMDAIHKTTDAKARDKLMQEHMRSMEANMNVLRMCCKKSDAAKDDATARQEMMEKRMDMMQTMLEQMMQRDKVDKGMAPMPHM